MIAADGRAEAGFGHLSRAGALAAALTERGYHVATCAVGAAHDLDRDVAWRAAPMLSDCPQPRPDGALVVDAYACDAPSARAGAPDAVIVMFADDSARAAGADLAISVAGSAPGATRVLSGFRHACLRREFWDLDPARVGDEGSVLVSAGATIAPLDIAESISQRNPALRVRVVASRPIEHRESVDVLIAPPSLVEPLSEAGLVVTAGGQTLLEALSCGKPTIVLVLAENQRAQAELAARADAAILVDPPEPRAVASAVAELARDPHRRAHLAKTARELVDGQGARRVAEELSTLLAEALR